jgi:uncharacterized protein (TIGR02001 family)
MKLKTLPLALSFAFFALPLTAMAQDATPTSDPAQETTADAPAASNFSWNAAITNDYVFRGVSQSDEDPALQGGIDYAFGDSGVYVGAWGSNVDFGRDGPDLEVDAYIGYTTDFADKWNVDVSVLRYNYIGSRDGYGSIDYNELIGKVSYNKMFTGVIAYANDYANTDHKGLYYGLEGAFDVGNDTSLNTTVGYTVIDGDAGFINNYFDASVGVSHAFGPVTADLSYHDTFGADSDSLGNIGDGRVVLSLSIGG